MVPRVLSYHGIYVSHDCAISKMKFQNRERLFLVLPIVKKKIIIMSTNPRFFLLGLRSVCIDTVTVCLQLYLAAITSNLHVGHAINE